MLALKDNCLHPTTSEPYVKTAVGGKDNSPEGAQVTPSLSVSPSLPSFMLWHNH